MTPTNTSLVKRGEGVEVIEDLLPLLDTEVTLRLPKPARRVSLEPQAIALGFEQTETTLSFTMREFASHQMVPVEWIHS